MASSKKNVTVKSIAEKLGISFSTVAKALNGDPLISAQTRELVEKTAKEMNYTRNVFASGLRQKRTRTVAIIVNDIDVPAYGEMISSISGKLAEHGYATMIFDSGYSKEIERNSILAMLSWMPEAIIFAPADPTDENMKMLLPVKEKVLIIGEPFGENINAITIDHRHAGFISAEKLLSNGSVSNLILGGPEGYRSSDLYIEGIRAAYKKYGVELSEKNIFRFKPDKQKAFECFNRYISNAQNDCDGVLCFCDSMAYGVYRAARELGLSIPEDISVIGYDDGPANEFTDPPLTTVRMPKNLIAEHCLDFIVNHLINGNAGVYNYSLNPTLSNRSSVRSKNKSQ